MRRLQYPDPEMSAPASIVPYQPFATSTTPVMLAVGNDSQFRALCADGVLDRPQWGVDERFATNSARVKNRVQLIGMLEEVFTSKTRDEWVEVLTGKGWAKPCGVTSAVLTEMDCLRIPFA